MSVRTLVKSIQNIMRQDTGVDGDAQRISQLCWMFFLKIIDDQDQELELMQSGYASPIPERLQWRSWAADPEGITGEALLAFVDDELFPALKNLPASSQSGDRRRVVRDVFEDAYNYMKSGQLMRQVVNKINDIDFNNLTERQHFGDIYEQILNDLQSAGNAGEYYTPRAVTAFMVDRIDPRPGETLFDPACGTGGFLTCALRHMRKRYVKRPGDERNMQAALRPSLTLADACRREIRGGDSENQDVAEVGTRYRLDLNRYMVRCDESCLEHIGHVPLDTCTCVSPTRSAPTAPY